MSTNAKVAIELMMSGASAVYGGLHSAASGVGKIGSAITSMNQAAYFAIQNIGSLAHSVQRLANTVIEPNIRTDRWREQITMLLRDSDLANAKLRELFEAATEAGMDTGELTRMYINLQRVGRGALTSASDMALWARAAKITNQDAASFGSTLASVWAALETRGGDAINRVVKQLYEMGLVSQAEAGNLQAMADAGASAESMWNAVRDAIANATGGVAGVADTWDDVTTRLRNYKNDVLGMIGAGLFEGMKDDMKGLSDTIKKMYDEGTIQSWAKNGSEKIKELYELAKSSSLGGVMMGDIADAIKTGNLSELMTEILSVAARNFWHVIVWGAKEYGPQIREAFIPPSLHGPLGENAAKLESLGAPKWASLVAGNWVGVTDLLENVPAPRPKNNPLVLETVSQSAIDRINEAAENLKAASKSLEESTRTRAEIDNRFVGILG